jgi:fructose-bisphosphate aldolase/6-deoxy-5-ketofructose 1-phosphate synthase
MEAKDVLVPLDVPESVRNVYIGNYINISKGTGRLMLFAGDQKVEHLNNDFFGPGISPDDAEPEHFFRIASRAKICVFATQLGLIARYGRDYPKIPYLVKLNSKSNLVKTEQNDPISTQWYTVQQAADFKKSSGLNIYGVGYTVYLGSQYEERMLNQAAQIIYEAHQRGLVTVIWMYPRGKAVKDEKDPHLIAGATGVGACLGTDFVKVNYPKTADKVSREAFKEAILAAGRTKVICAGGAAEDERKFLQTLHDQINFSGASGSATGRNIHEKPLDKAIAMCNAIYSITCEGASVGDALSIYEKGKIS